MLITKPNKYTIRNTKDVYHDHDYDDDDDDDDDDDLCDVKNTFWKYSQWCSVFVHRLSNTAETL